MRFCFFVLRLVSLCSPNVLEFPIEARLFSSACWELGLKECATMPGHLMIFSMKVQLSAQTIIKNFNVLISQFWDIVIWYTYMLKNDVRKACLFSITKQFFLHEQLSLHVHLKKHYNLEHSIGSNLCQDVSGALVGTMYYHAMSNEMWICFYFSVQGSGEVVWYCMGEPNQKHLEFIMYLIFNFFGCFVLDIFYCGQVFHYPHTWLWTKYDLT